MSGFLRHRYSPLALTIVAAVFVLLAPVFWMRVELPQGMVSTSPYKSADLYERAYPNLHYGFGRLSAGELPLWNPYQFCGVPFQADPSTGLFQPLNALFLFLPVERAMAAHAFLCLFLMGCFFALFLRSLELRYLSCVFGGIVYAFSGAAASAMSRPELASVLAWAPLLFWSAREFSREQRAGILLAGALAGAGMLLSGGYGLSVVLLLLWLPYALLLALHKHPFEGRRPLRGGLGVLLLLLLAFGLSAVQWLPALLWNHGLADPATLWKLDVAAVLPHDLRTFLAQILSGQSDLLPRPGYLGIGALLVIPGAFFHRTARTDALYFLAAAIAAVALALIPYVLFGVISQSAWIFAATFALATLAGIGVDKLFTATRDPFSPFVWIPVALLLLLAGAILLAGTNHVRGLLVVYLVLLLPYLLIRSRWLAKPCSLAVTAFLFIDCCLGSVNHYRHPFVEGAAITPELRQVLRSAEEQALQGRILNWGPPAPLGLPANTGMLARLFLAGGDSIPLTQAQQDWWARLPASVAMDEELGTGHPALLNYLAARVLLAGEESAYSMAAVEREGVRLEFLRARDKIRLYHNTTALSRAYWTPQWYPASSPQAAMEILVSPAFRPIEVSVVQGEEAVLQPLEALVPRSAPPAPDAPPSAAEAAEAAEAATAQVQQSAVDCRIVDAKPERVVVQFEAPQPGLLILADSYDPDWRATVDDRPVEILRGNALFRAVPVPAGAHLVVFEYVPTPFWAGLTISLVTFGLLIVTGLLRLFR